MKLSVSNIAWPTDRRFEMYAALQEAGIEGVEVAPTTLGDWEQLSGATLRRERKILENFGLRVSSYQALYFGCPHLQLLGDETSFQLMLDHTLRVAQIARELSEGGVGVFGAPKNRRRTGLSEQAAFALGVERFRLLADQISELGFSLAIESAPAFYGGDFLEKAEECAAFVREVNHTAVRLHLDTGCMELSGEDPAAIAIANPDLLGHVHLSRPGLLPFTGEDKHLSFSRALVDIGYDRWLAIEMKAGSNPLHAVLSAVSYAREYYSVT